MNDEEERAKRPFNIDQAPPKRMVKRCGTCPCCVEWRQIFAISKQNGRAHMQELRKIITYLKAQNKALAGSKSI